jgi:hypothetical protein
LGLLAGASRLEVAGQSLGGFLGHLLIAPADARKAHHHAPHWPGFGARGSEPSAFLPSAHAPAFPSSGPTQAFAPLPAAQDVRTPSEIRKLQGFFARSRTLQPELPHDRMAKDASGAFGRPKPEAAPAGRWEVVVQRPDGPSRIERALPAQQLASVPLQGDGQSAGVRPHMPFQRLLDKLARQGSRSAQAPKQASSQAPAPGAKPRPGATAGAGGAKPGLRRLGARPLLTEPLPPVGTYKPDEVLAINLSAEGLAKARASDYQVAGYTELPEFGLVITHLKPPPTLNAVSGREKLFDLLPDDGFTLNHVYAPYRPGSGRGGGTGASVAAESGAGCPAERCFAGTLINWQPRLASCARDVKVGVVDTGFDKSHPAFAGVHYEYREFLPEGSTRASSQHGTGVLSLLAGGADSGTPGLIPDASYLVANAFFDDAGGQPISDTAQMIRALHWLRQNGVAVANLSFAGPEDELVHHAVQELTRAGAVVVAAAGNEGPGAPPSYPAGYPEVIAVTAVDRNLAAYRYANRGPQIDLAAPGVDVWTAMPGRREGAQTGTSFAVPFVTAVVAVAMPSAGLLPDENATAAKRRALARLHANIKALGETGRDPVFGEGLIQAPATCEPPLLTVAAAVTGPTAQPWAGTVHRAVDADTLVVGSWVSTVRAVTAGEGGAR